MGTILFIILRLAGLVNTANDWLYLCMLVSLDSIGVPTLIKAIRK
jgi:hypothetical protein